jgi:hypothetical protein
VETPYLSPIFTTMASSLVARSFPVASGGAAAGAGGGAAAGAGGGAAPAGPVYHVIERAGLGIPNVSDYVVEAEDSITVREYRRLRRITSSDEAQKDLLRRVMHLVPLAAAIDPSVTLARKSFPGWEYNAWDMRGLNQCIAGLPDSAWIAEEQHDYHTSHWGIWGVNIFGYCLGSGKHVLTGTRANLQGFIKDSSRLGKSFVYIHELTGTELDPEGYNFFGLDPEGRDRRGFTPGPAGLDKDGFNRQGRNLDAHGVWRDRKGCDEAGYKVCADGVERREDNYGVWRDKSNRDEYGRDPRGYDRLGYKMCADGVERNKDGKTRPTWK